MLNYVHQFFKIRVRSFPHALFWNEVGDPKFLFISDTSNSLPDCSKYLKNLSTRKFSREGL